MANDYKTQSTLLGLYADNSSGDISAQDFRDGVVSWQTMPSVVPVSEAHGGGTGTRADRATAVGNAITDATNNGLGYVLVTDPYLNYDASAVTFDNSVRMVREGQVGDVYDVKAYGAAGDNTADDTAAVQAAIDAAMANRGGVVFLPVADPGYRVTATLSVTERVNITGASKETSTIAPDSFTSGQIVFDVNGLTLGQINRMIWRSFRISGDGSEVGIRLRDCSRCLWGGLNLTGLDIGVRVSDNSFSHVWSGCHFNNATSEHIRLDVGSHDWAFDGCQFVGGGTRGIWVTGALSALLVEGSNFEGLTAAGIDIGHASGTVRSVSVLGSRFEKNDGSRDLDIGSAGGLVEGATVVGTFFNTSSSGGNSHAILLDDLDGFEVRSCVFENYSTAAINLDIADNGSVAHNVGSSTPSIVDAERPSVELRNNVGFSTLQGRRIEYRTAAPASGTFERGDLVWNTEPSAGGTPGWVCVSGGSPGTWKAMANVAA